MALFKSPSKKGSKLKLVNRKIMQIVNLWIKSIINHLWWCCSTCEGNYTLLKEKWVSMLYHIRDIHHWDGTEYTQCLHRVYTNKIKWFDFESPAFQALSRIVNGNTILNDMMYLTEFRHTGNLEVYHSLLLKYWTKRLHFSMAGMIARSELAIMDSGVQCEQATWKDV